MVKNHSVKKTNKERKKNEEERKEKKEKKMIGIPRENHQPQLLMITNQKFKPCTKV